MKRISVILIVVGLLVLESIGQTSRTQLSAGNMTNRQLFDLNHSDSDCSQANLLLAVLAAARRLKDYYDEPTAIGVASDSTATSITTFTMPSTAMPSVYQGKTRLEQMRAEYESRRQRLAGFESDLIEAERESAEVQWIKRLAKNCGESR